METLTEITNYPPGRRCQTSIRHRLLNHLTSNAPSGFEELVALFQYKVYRETVRRELHRLENLGQVAYCPQSRTFYLPDRRLPDVY